jgi:hypothetical protein
MISVVLAAVSLVPLAAQAVDTFTANFGNRIDQYMALRERQAQVCRLISSDQQHIEAATEALALAIADARMGARPGDLFGDDARAAFGPRIHAALKAADYSVADLLVEINVEAPRRRATLAVNERFDWRYGALMPPSIIAALPGLPHVLQYRFVGRDLVLVDVEAGLIVDILPGLLGPQ